MTVSAELNCLSRAHQTACWAEAEIKHPQLVSLSSAAVLMLVSVLVCDVSSSALASALLGAHLNLGATFASDKCGKYA